MKHKLYTRLLSLALAVGLVIGMLPSAAAVDTVGDGAGQPVTFADPDSPLKLAKTVTDNGNKTYTVNLEAYTTGTVTSTEESVPADIVLVLDESGSMAYDIGTSPVYSGQLNTSKTYYQINGDNARKITYSTQNRSWGYSSGLFGRWTSITPTTGPDDTNENHVQLYESYSTRETAIVNAVNSFLDEISKDNANLPEDVTDHRVAMIGFSGEGSARTIRSLTTQLDHIDTNTLNTSGGTYINYGLQMVDDVFNDESSAVAGEKRNRVVVVFTDGNPGSGNETNEDHSHAAQAVNTANTIKKSVTEGGCGATIFTVGIFTGADPSDTSSWPNKYMNGMSSNYANAVGEEGEYHYSWVGGYWDPEPSITLGTQTQNANYYLSASDTEALNDIFETIADQTSSPSISLGEDAQVIDEVTQYFDLPSNASAITIQQADYNGSSFGAAYNAPSTVQARIDGQKVIVTGFDFDKNFVTSTAKQDGTYGKKLIISFTITPDPEFWGGNQVPTNVLETSGVTDSSGVLAGNFPDPGTQDVPLKKIALTDKNVNVYYGGATPDAAGLVNQITFPDDWRTAYVEDITYSVNNTVSNTADGAYTVTATLSPTYTGKYDSNTATANANVDVFKPVVTWTDSTQAYKTPLNGTLLNSHHVSTTWEREGKTSDNMYGEAPTLTYTFTDKTGSALSETLTQETHVKVSAVKIGENDITGATSFEWQKDGSCPETCDNPNNAYQFRIHVQKGGLTITKTVEGLDENGLNELKDKLTFDVTGNNGYEQTVLFNATGWTYTPNQDGTYTCTYTLDVPTGTYTVTESGYENITNYLFDSANSTTQVTNINVTTSGATAALTNTYTLAEQTLKIYKNLSGFANEGKPVFSFKITDLYTGDVWYYHIDMTDKTPNQDEPVIELTLPAGHEYRVEELSNQNYEFVKLTQDGVVINPIPGPSTRELIIENGGQITLDKDTELVFYNDPVNSNIPTDGGATENRVDKVDNVIVWKKDPVEYGNDHNDNITPDPDAE